VNDGRCLADAIAPAHVNSVSVAIPDQFDRREWVIPTKITPNDARPVPRKIALLNREHFLCDGENATAAENWNTFDARFAFMRCIGGHDPRLVRLREVRRVVDGRANHGAVRMRCTAGRQKTLHDRAHAEQGRKAQIDDPAGFVGAG